MPYVPFFSEPEIPVDDDVIAALDAETVWLLRSGELDNIYRCYRGFNARCGAFDRLIKERRSAGLAQMFAGREVTFIGHLHDEAASLILQVMAGTGKPLPAADRIVAMKLREGLDPTGRPLPDGED